MRTRLNIWGARDGDFRIRIGNRPTRRGTINVPLPPDTVKPGAVRFFHSRPDVRPPVVTVDRREPRSTPGKLLITPKTRERGSRQAGPMIVDEGGEPVWFRPLPGLQAFDLRVQTYKGQPVLTWWQGTHVQGMGSGEGRIFDTNYRLVKKVRAGNGYRSDLHDFFITPQNTAVLTIYGPVRRDLSGVGGARHGILVDSIVQEIDLETGLVLFEWHSIGQVAAKESYSPAPPNPRLPHDYFHVNSVDLDSEGNFLLSGRGTWAVYKVGRRTGTIAWRLGGKRSTFKVGRGAHFAWQHDARFQPGGRISIFDNSAAPPVRKRSRAIELALDHGARTATLVRSDDHVRILAATQGNVQWLGNGHRVVGWGSQRYFSEFAPDGALVFDAHVAVGYDTYRAYRAAWSARPLSKPRISAEVRGGGRTAIFISWNGATDVASWEILAGPSPGALSPVAMTRRTGFETALKVTAPGPYFAARARDAAGTELGTSAARRRR